jgi:tetratricopeptide (TPR) repeat protein
VFVIRSFRQPFILFAALVAFVAAGIANAGAAPKATPTPAPTPVATAVPSPSATVEPLDRAIPRLEAKLKTDPTDKATMSELAQDYYNANRPDLTLALTQKLLAGGTKTGQMYYLDGIANAALGRTKEAVDALQNASNLEPINAAVLGALTSLLLRDNRPADAERVAKRAITFNKDDKESLITYGRVLASEQKFDDARTQYEAAAKVDPKDALPIVLEAQTYSAQNAIALAAQVYDRAVTVDPRSIDALVGKAGIQATQHDVKGAIATYGQLLAIETNDEERSAVVDQMGKVYAVEKMNPEADAMYKKAIADYPKVPTAHLAYGDYLAFIKDMPGAEREWTTAVGPNRDYPEALARLGELYASKNDFARQIDATKRWTEVASQDPRAFLVLGQAYGGHRDYAKAREAFRTSYALGHTPESLLGLAQADFEMHNYKECSTIYSSIDKAAPQLTKQNPQLLFLLGQCYDKGGDKKNARVAYTRFVPYLKAGSPDRKKVEDMIKNLDAKPAAKPTPAAKSTSAPKK